MLAVYTDAALCNVKSLVMGPKCCLMPQIAGTTIDKAHHHDYSGIAFVLQMLFLNLPLMKQKRWYRDNAAGPSQSICAVLCALCDMPRWH